MRWNNCSQSARAPFDCNPALCSDLDARNPVCCRKGPSGFALDVGPMGRPSSSLDGKFRLRIRELIRGILASCNEEAIYGPYLRREVQRSNREANTENHRLRKLILKSGTHEQRAALHDQGLRSRSTLLPASTTSDANGCISSSTSKGKGRIPRLHTCHVGPPEHMQQYIYDTRVSSRHDGTLHVRIPHKRIHGVARRAIFQRGIRSPQSQP